MRRGAGELVAHRVGTKVRAFGNACAGGHERSIVQGEVLRAGAELPRVLYLADKLGYPGGVSYGVTTYCVNVLPALVKAGVPLNACFLRGVHPAADVLESFGVRPLFLSAHRFDPSVLWPVIKLIRQHRFEILHATGYASTVMARLAARFLPVRTVVHAHDLHVPGVAVRGLEAALARRSDVGVCVSEAARAVAAEVYRLQSDQIRVITNGIDLERFRDVPEGARMRVRAELGIPAPARVIGIVARLYTVKGHRALIRMMHQVLGHVDEAHLLIVGDGPDRTDCEALVDELGLRERVNFTGERSDVADLLCGCDVFAMPSDSEGFPMSAVEALAMGVPVVGYDVGGVGEVVDHGSTGWLVPHGDEDGFVSALVSLLSDPDTLAAWSANGKVAAERFGVAQHVRQLVELYRELAAPQGPGALHAA